ncbi:hypothetical protein BGZ83_007123 [Gryganskiella cystojenkinii]|nr:hypothetical protein BGZ83_007123 [Gryganskiella cystojenkinii]
MVRLLTKAMLFGSIAASITSASVIPKSAILHNYDKDTDMHLAAKHFFEKRDGSGVVSSCTVPNTVAVTFDDGPFAFTSELLDFLARENVKATFFMNGHNVGDIWQYDWVVKRAFSEGHQIASHTWGHKDLGTATEGEVADEMTRLDEAFKSIIGVRPLFMRPPFGNLNWASENYLSKNGYKIINWGIDTNDWRHPGNIDASLEVYKSFLTRSGAHRHGFIGLEHDTLGTTAERLAPMIIKYAKEQGFEIVTVGACLGLDPSQWYR